MPCSLVYCWYIVQSSDSAIPSQRELHSDSYLRSDRWGVCTSLQNIGVCAWTLNLFFFIKLLCSLSLSVSTKVNLSHYSKSAFLMSNNNLQVLYSSVQQSSSIFLEQYEGSRIGNCVSWQQIITLITQLSHCICIVTRKIDIPVHCNVIQCQGVALWDSPAHHILHPLIVQ